LGVNRGGNRSGVICFSNTFYAMLRDGGVNLMVFGELQRPRRNHSTVVSCLSLVVC
jgi:hypothetical protein